MARKVISPKTVDKAFNEALEFYKNAKGVLNKSPVEFGAYKMPKYVKEASAMAYLAVLRFNRCFSRGIYICIVKPVFGNLLAVHGIFYFWAVL